MRRIRAIVPFVLAAAVLSAARASAQDSPIPESIAPSPAVLEAAAAAYLTPEERSDFRVRHGLYDDLDLSSPARRALVALERGRYLDPSLADAAVPAVLRVRALARMGDAEAVLRVTEGATELPLLALRAESLAAIGRRDESLAIVNADAVRAALAGSKEVDEVLAAVDLRALAIRLDAANAGEYPELLRALGRARDTLDRLDPRVRLREAQLLSILESASDAIIVTDARLSIVMANTAALRCSKRSRRSSSGPRAKSCR